MTDNYLSEDEILKLAKTTAEEQGWLWKDPVKLTKELDHVWMVRTNADSIGTNIEIYIDAKSGSITRKVYLKR